ncbi:hypothetical protein FQA39_LY18852 [Lamprigera yunnana]|nr:hypothetical protein FQA39_LY18852 [Lamprigera yunnana]
MIRMFARSFRGVRRAAHPTRIRRRIVGFDLDNRRCRMPFGSRLYCVEYIRPQGFAHRAAPELLYRPTGNQYPARCSRPEQRRANDGETPFARVRVNEEQDRNDDADTCEDLLPGITACTSWEKRNPCGCRWYSTAALLIEPPGSPLQEAGNRREPPRLGMPWLDTADIRVPRRKCPPLEVARRRCPAHQRDQGYAESETQRPLQGGRSKEDKTETSRPNCGRFDREKGPDRPSQKNRQEHSLRLRPTWVNEHRQIVQLLKPQHLGHQPRRREEHENENTTRQWWMDEREKSALTRAVERLRSDRSRFDLLPVRMARPTALCGIAKQLIVND